MRSRRLYNYFVLSTWQFGKVQFFTVVRAPLGSTFLDHAVAQSWVGGRRWEKRDHNAHTFATLSRARRTMARLARLERGS